MGLYEREDEKCRPTSIHFASYFLPTFRVCFVFKQILILNDLTHSLERVPKIDKKRYWINRRIIALILLVNIRSIVVVGAIAIVVADVIGFVANRFDNIFKMQLM